MKNNKGFSLVELIIVIAIMAILVGVMAPQLIKYIEKTNVSSDVQLCDTVRSALVTAAMDPDVVKKGSTLKANYNGDVTGCYTEGTGTTGETFQSQVEDILGTTLATVSNGLKSKDAKGKTLQVQTGTTGNNVRVYVATGTTTVIEAGSITGAAASTTP